MTTDSFPPDRPDSHGEAALLLAESMLHGLVARAVVPVTEAIEMVEIAMDARVEIADAGADASRGGRDAFDLLAEIKLSLENDVPAPPGPPSADKA